MPKLKHRAAKLYRKVRVSGSVDQDAFEILQKIAAMEKRNMSNALNLVLYEAGERRGIKITMRREPEEPSTQ